MLHGEQRDSRFLWAVSPPVFPSTCTSVSTRRCVVSSRRRGGMHRTREHIERHSDRPPGMQDGRARHVWLSGAPWGLPRCQNLLYLLAAYSQPPRLVHQTRPLSVRRSLPGSVCRRQDHRRRPCRPQNHQTHRLPGLQPLVCPRPAHRSFASRPAGRSRGGPSEKGACGTPEGRMGSVGGETALPANEMLFMLVPSQAGWAGFPLLRSLSLGTRYPDTSLPMACSGLR